MDLQDQLTRDCFQIEFQRNSILQNARALYSSHSLSLSQSTFNEHRPVPALHRFPTMIAAETEWMGSFSAMYPALQN